MSSDGTIVHEAISQIKEAAKPKAEKLRELSKQANLKIENDKERRADSLVNELLTAAESQAKNGKLFYQRVMASESIDIMGLIKSKLEAEGFKVTNNDSKSIILDWSENA